MGTTFTISGAVLRKAGLNVNAGLLSGGVYISGTTLIIDHWINDAESIINSATRKNWVSAYDGLNANYKNILGDAASSLAAMNCIVYDMDGYTSSVKAQVMLDVLRDNFLRDLDILKDKKTEDFID